MEIRIFWLQVTETNSTTQLKQKRECIGSLLKLKGGTGLRYDQFRGVKGHYQDSLSLCYSSVLWSPELQSLPVQTGFFHETRRTADPNLFKFFQQHDQKRRGPFSNSFCLHQSQRSILVSQTGHHILIPTQSQDQMQVLAGWSPKIPLSQELQGGTGGDTIDHISSFMLFRQ